MRPPANGLTGVTSSGQGERPAGIFAEVLLQAPDKSFPAPPGKQRPGLYISPEDRIKKEFEPASGKGRKDDVLAITMPGMIVAGVPPRDDQDQEDQESENTEEYAEETLLPDHRFHLLDIIEQSSCPHFELRPIAVLRKIEQRTAVGLYFLIELLRSLPIHRITSAGVSRDSAAMPERYIFAI